MAAQPAKTKTDTVVHPVTSAAIMDAFRELVFLVPEAAEDDGSSIIAGILEATDLDDLNSDDALPSSKTLVGRQVKVLSIARKVSDQQSATGYYLMCEGEDPRTHKPIRFTAGGSQAVAVLAKCYVMHWFPLVVEFTETMTRSGNSAVNCRVVAKGGTGEVVG